MKVKISERQGSCVQNKCDLCGREASFNVRSMVWTQSEVLWRDLGDGRGAKVLGMWRFQWIDQRIEFLFLSCTFIHFLNPLRQQGCRSPSQLQGWTWTLGRQPVAPAAALSAVQPAARGLAGLDRLLRRQTESRYRMRRLPALAS